MSMVAGGNVFGELRTPEKTRRKRIQTHFALPPLFIYRGV